MLGNLYGITFMNALIMDGDTLNFDKDILDGFDIMNIADNSPMIEQVQLELQYIQDTVKDFVEKNKPSENDIQSNKPKSSAFSLEPTKEVKPEDTREGIEFMVNKSGLKNKLSRAVLEMVLNKREKLMNLSLNREPVNVNIYKLANRPLTFLSNKKNICEVNKMISHYIDSKPSKGYDAIRDVVSESEKSMDSLSKLSASHSFGFNPLKGVELYVNNLTKIFKFAVTEDMFEEATQELNSIGFYGFNDIQDRLIDYCDRRIISSSQDREFAEAQLTPGYIWFEKTIEDLSKGLEGFGTIPVYEQSRELLSGDGMVN